MLERGQVIPKDIELVSDKTDFLKVYNEKSVYVTTPFPKAIKGIESYAEVHNISSRQMISFNGRMEVLESELKSYAKKNYTIFLVSSRCV